MFFSGEGQRNLRLFFEVTTIAAVTFNVPANTEPGIYTVGAKNIRLTNNYGTVWEETAEATTTLTITDDSGATMGYTAGLTSLPAEVRVGDTIPVNVGVSHSADSVFAAGEVVVRYDNTKLRFNKTASNLGATTVKDNAGTLTLEDYGADKNFGDSVYKLAFDAIADGETNIALTSAAFVNKDDAVKSDLIPANLSPASVDLTINKRTYTVTLPDIFTGPATVVDGEDYTFSQADGTNYNYNSVRATMNGANVNVINNGNGTYTIENVTGDLVITGTRTAKSYSVTFAGNAAGDITDGAETATYNTNYTFTLPSKDGWAYRVDSITIGGTAYTGYSVENAVYTIPGSAINGNIVITVSKSATKASVTVEGSGAGAAAGYNSTATIGEPYTLTIHPEAGYTYTVSATMEGKTVNLDVNDNSYTIGKVTGNIVFTVDRAVIVDGVTVSKYLTLDGTVMWLVKNETTLAANKVPTYDGEKMFWSEAYGAYCYLVVAETLTVENAQKKVDITDGTAVAVNYGMDVNMTDKIDASDAQLTYNMYNAVYAKFTEDLTVEKFLRADINADATVDVRDATAIITAILDNV